jgi:hypothetical protein
MESSSAISCDYDRVATYVREAVDSDTSRELPRVREDRTLVVGAVPGMVAMGRAVRRRITSHEFGDCSHLPGLTRLRAAARLRCTAVGQIAPEVGPERKQPAVTATSPVVWPKSCATHRARAG